MGDDDASQRVAKLAGNFLVSRAAVVVAETDFCIGLRRLEKDAPAIVRHLHVIEMGPAFGADVDSGAQPDIFFLKAVGAHLAPPVEVVWQPLLECPLKFLVLRKIYVVRNAFV